MYPPSLVPEKYQFLYDLNPLARFTVSYRGYLFQDRAPSVENIVVGAAMALLTVSLGYYIFKRLEPHFADRI
jgi:ABC-type polysaccharide/polyol phosphate export permease